MASSPFEIISAPFEVYMTTGTDAFPDAASTPTGGWVLLGTNGKRNQAEGGVVVEHNQTLREIRTEGHTGIVKMVRTAEDTKVRFTLLDLTKEIYKHALNGDAPSAQGTTGFEVGLSRAENVRECKILVRGPSPVADQRNCQFQLPRCVQTGSASVQLSKTAEAGIELEFTALDQTGSVATGQRMGVFSAAV